jgi:hypothetical protein
MINCDATFSASMRKQRRPRHVAGAQARELPAPPPPSLGVSASPDFVLLQKVLNKINSLWLPSLTRKRTTSIHDRQIHEKYKPPRRISNKTYVPVISLLLNPHHRQSATLTVLHPNLSHDRSIHGRRSRISHHRYC